MSVIERSASIRIKKSLSEVFNFVAAPGNFPRWQTFVEAAEVTSQGSVSKGTTYRYCFEAMGKVIETTGVITEFHPFSDFSYQTTTSPFPIKGGFRFKETGGFVEVTAFGEADPGGNFSMAGSLIGMLLGRELNVMLQKLKEILERDS